MSVSDLTKKALVAHFAAQGVETKPAHWKRRSKETVNEDYTARLFENDVAKLSAYGLTSDERDMPPESPDEITIWETGTLGYGIGIEDGDPYLTFVPLWQWERNASVPSLDDHIERAIPGFPMQHCGDDMGDNRFAIGEPYHVRCDLNEHGAQEILELTARLGG